MTERPTSPDCSMSSSSSLTAESSVTGCRGSSSVERAPPARDRAWANDCRTALAPRTAESVGASPPEPPPAEVPPAAAPVGGAADDDAADGDVGAGPVAQSGAGPVVDPQPALSWSERPETGLSPASASAAPPDGDDPPWPPVPVGALPPEPAASCPAPASPQDARPAPPSPAPAPPCPPSAGPPGAPLLGGSGSPAGTTPAGGATGVCCDTVSMWMPSTTASTPSSSMSACRTMSAWLPARKVCVSPAVAMPSVRVLPSKAVTWAFCETKVHVMRRIVKMRPRTLGHARRMASVSMPPADPACVAPPGCPTAEGDSGADTGAPDEPAEGPAPDRTCSDAPSRCWPPPLDSTTVDGPPTDSAGVTTGGAPTSARAASMRPASPGPGLGAGPDGPAADSMPVLRPPPPMPPAACEAPAPPPLDTGEAGGIPLLAGGGRQEDARADQLELQPRGRGAGHLGEAGVDDVGRTRERTRAEARLLDAHALELVLGDAAQHLSRALGDRGHDDEVAQALEQVLDETARVVARLDDLVDLAEGGGA